MERTLIIVKPEGVQRGLVGEVLRRFEAKGLKVLALKMIRMDEALAARHYAEHKGKDFYGSLIAHITSSPVVVGVLEGEAAVESVRTLVGKTNPAQAAPGTIRADLASELSRNVVHASDSVVSAEREVSVFFAPYEVLNWPRETDRWIRV